ncbi:MAG: galactitol-1-phosphate 5-dehydrogenase [Spirochaetota bacterium]
MKALELKAYNDLQLTDVAKPTPAKDEVLIRVRAVGICGSDVHGLDGSTGRRIPPVIMGHEASGVIEEAGADCHSFSPGEAVTFDSTLYCGECYYCRRGQVNLCDNRKTYGVSCDEYRRDGAFAEYIAVPERGLYRIPENVSFEHAAMVEPVAIAMHAAELAPRSVADSAVVVGAGNIGLMLIQVLRAAGYGLIVAVDVDERKLRTAGELGADYGVDPGNEDVGELVSSLTDGRGTTAAFDAVGLQSTFETALRAVRKGGTVVMVGNLTPELSLPAQYAIMRQVRLQGTVNSCGEYPACVEMIARGAIKLDPLLSAVAPLSEGPDWFARLYNNTEGLLKVILKP